MNRLAQVTELITAYDPVTFHESQRSSRNAFKVAAKRLVLAITVNQRLLLTGHQLLQKRVSHAAHCSKEPGQAQAAS
jgi:hypothetical protein